MPSTFRPGLCKPRDVHAKPARNRRTDFVAIEDCSFDSGRLDDFIGERGEARLHS